MIDRHTRCADGEAFDLWVILGALDEGEQFYQGVRIVEESETTMPDGAEKIQIQIIRPASTASVEEAAFKSACSEGIGVKGVVAVFVKARLGLEAGLSQPEFDPYTERLVVEVAPAQPQSGHEFEGDPPTPVGVIAGPGAGDGVVAKEGEALVAQGAQGQVEGAFAGRGGQGGGEGKSQGKAGRRAQEGTDHEGILALG